MLGVFVFGAVLGAAGPSPAPLKTISHVRSSPFCTTLHENVGHAVAALIANKSAIADGKAMLLRMAQDRTYRANPGGVLDVDMVEIDRVVGAMVTNLRLTDAALDDLERIPAEPKTGDDKRLAAMRDALRAVEERQRIALNVFSGMYESYGSNELARKLNPLAPATRTEAQAPPNFSGEQGADMGAPVVLPPIKSGDASPASSSTPNATHAAVPVRDVGLAARTPFAHLFNSITADQIDEEALESQAAKTILQYTTECK